VLFWHTLGRLLLLYFVPLLLLADSVPGTGSLFTVELPLAGQLPMMAEGNREKGER
jgi:hypothetical protein